MRWKQFIVIPALMLVLITSVAPIKVVAQGLVEYALILVDLVVGPGEVIEFLWLPGPSQENPRVPQIAPGSDVTFIFVVTNTGDATCTQTISSPVVANTGPNILMVSRNADFLLINGEKVEQFNDCLRDSIRTAIAIGRPFPRDLFEQMGSDPNAIRPQLQNMTVLGSIISSSSGATVASGGGRSLIEPTVYGLPLLRVDLPN
jgi:hypothetical protein